MKYLVQTVLMLALFAASTPLLAGGAKSVSSKYAGYGYDTAVDLNEDGFPVSVTHATGKGSFGNSTLAITVEFAPDPSLIGNCPAGFELSFDVVPTNYWATVVTAADQSQLYGLFNTGWLCMTADLLHWVGYAEGAYVGGTGRFEGASGEWMTTYRGTNLDGSIGLRSITGELTGTLYQD